jgi:hypothetical protein
MDRRREALGEHDRLSLRSLDRERKLIREASGRCGEETAKNDRERDHAGGSGSDSACSPLLNHLQFIPSGRTHAH